LDYEIPEGQNIQPKKIKKELLSSLLREKEARKEKSDY